MGFSPLLQGVVGEGPGAGGGAELLAAVPSTTTAAAATGEQIILGVAEAPQHRPGQLARGGGGGEEHLRSVVSTIASGYQDG